MQVKCYNVNNIFFAWFVLLQICDSRSEQVFFAQINDLVCCSLWCHLSSLPYQFSVFEHIGGLTALHLFRFLKGPIYLNLVEQKRNGYLFCQKKVYKLDLRAEPCFVALTPSPILGIFHWQHPNLQSRRSIVYWYIILFLLNSHIKGSSTHSQIS